VSLPNGIHRTLPQGDNKDGTGQHFCSPARPELTRNRLGQPVYCKLQLIFWPGPWPVIQSNLKCKVTTSYQFIVHCTIKPWSLKAEWV